MTETETRAAASRRNERLAEAMRDAGLSAVTLAAAIGRNPKSVQRWVYEGRIPRSATQQKAGQALGVPASVLWPTGGDDAPVAPPDLIRIYVDIREVPSTLWTDLIERAEQVTIVSGEYPFLPDPDMAKALELRAATGVPIRLCFGPTSAIVRIPGSSVAMRRTDQRPLSMFHLGAEMLVWLNVGGPSMARLGPVMHLQKAEHSGLFDAYAHVLGEIWASAGEALRPW